MKKLLLLASFFFALNTYAQGPSSPSLLIYNPSCSGTFLYNIAAGACLATGGGGSGNVSNGGNSFGTAMTLGTLDNNYLQFTANNNIFNWIYPNSTYAAYPYVSWGTQPTIGTSQTNQYYFYSKSNGAVNDKNYTGLFVENDLDNTTDGSGYQQGIYGVVHSNANTGTYALLRNYFMAESTGNGTITETYGARALTRIYDANYPTTVSTGTIQNGYGLEVYAHSTSPTAVMQNATGILVSHANAGNSAGTGSDSAIHTAYGIHIQNDIIATGSATQNIAYAILSDSTAQSMFNGDMLLEQHSKLRLSDTNYHYINITAPSSFSSTYNIVLPTADGSAGQYVKTDGFGNWSWGNPTSGLTSLTIGTPGFTDTGTIMQLTATTAGYEQAIIQNQSSSASASADFIVANNAATASTYYGDFGMNSSGYTGSGSINLPNAVYLYSQSSDLVLGTSSTYGIHFFVNGGTTDSLTINSAGLSTFTGGLVTTSAAPSLTFYNTADQVTNYEKTMMSYSGNIFGITATAGGTGTTRAIQLLSGGIGVTADFQATLLSIASKINLGFGSSSTPAGAGLVSVTGTVTQASSVQNVFGITPTVNQSSTGGVNLLYVSPYLQATGSGGTSLVNIGTNSAANGSGTHTPLFQVDTNGTIFGKGVYTTVSSNTVISLKPQSAYTAAGTGVGLAAGVNFSTTSGQVYAVAITPTYNEVTSSAANTDLIVNRTQTSIGSGAQLLLDLQVGGASKFSVSNTALISMPTTNTATTVGAAGAASTLPTAPTGYLIVNIGGTNYKLPYYNN